MKFWTIALTLFISACAHERETSNQSQVAADQAAYTNTQNLEYGTWVFAKFKEGGESVRDQYVAGAFALAKEQGMQEKQGFAIGKTLMGELNPDFVGLYAWPNKEAASAARNNTAYQQKFAPLRHQGWDELVAVDVGLENQGNWELDPKRYYTIALAWTGSQESYQKYIASTAKIREQLGFKIVFNAPVEAWTHLGMPPNERKPDRISLLEWPNSEVPQQYLQLVSDAYYSEIASQAFEKLSWHEVKPY